MATFQNNQSNYKQRIRALDPGKQLLKGKVHKKERKKSLQMLVYICTCKLILGIHYLQGYCLTSDSLCHSASDTQLAFWELFCFVFFLTYNFTFDSAEGYDGLGQAFLTLWEWIIRALSPGPGTSITVWGIKRVMEHRNSIRPMRKLTNSPNPSEISKVSRFLSSVQQQCIKKKIVSLLHFWNSVYSSCNPSTV